MIHDKEKTKLGIVHRASCIVHHDNRGFTLIETIMVMVIAVILAAVVAVRWSPFDTIKLNSATRKVAADIRYAQKLAISTQTTYSAIAFNTNGYTVYETYASVISRCPGDPCSDSGGTFVVDFSDASRCSNYSEVTLTNNDGTLITLVVRFNSLGTPVDASGTAVGSDQIAKVNYKGSGKAITIATGTGRVSY
ncbi:MAG: prepilin-type N-terminal cleavage/methylation domain-containing protein [Nitrospirota bacterium]|nr:prepilin-type N-terminal cleavage/methylation domain-containing protein [Nitrospirota bacterium]